MARPISTEELRLIESLVVQCEGGAGITALELMLARRLASVPQRRTLQRRLARLIEDGHIVAEGKSTALIYKAVHQEPPAHSEVATEPSAASEHEPYIRLSAEGSAIRAVMQTPLKQRRRTGYHRGFLNNYQPRVTYYLPESLRADLHEMGGAGIAQHAGRSSDAPLRNRLLVDLPWASSRIEGNRYSREEALKLLTLGHHAGGRSTQETQMLLNQKAATELLLDGMEGIDMKSIGLRNLHAVLSQELATDPSACGRLRRRPVAINGTRYQPLAMPKAIEDCFKLLCDKAVAIDDPFEQAFFLLVQLPYLHPFEQLNRQVSRIACNIPLIRHNLCLFSFIDVPEEAYFDGVLGVYELEQVELLRDVFVWGYERSCQAYLAASDTMTHPHPLRIHYSKTLQKAVRSIVKNLRPPSHEVIQELARAYAATTDHHAFAIMLAESLDQLHEGSLARYRLRRSEFKTWAPIRDNMKNRSTD